MAKILIADDNTGLRDALVEMLLSLGHDARGAGDGLEAKAAALEGDFDLLLTDLRMPGLDGMSLIRELAEAGHLPATLVMTAHGSVERAVRWRNWAITKPWPATLRTPPAPARVCPAWASR